MPMPLEGGGVSNKRRCPLNATPVNFPCGTTATRKHLRLAFRNSADARTTITNFQRDNGLHAQFARAFATVPAHEASSSAVRVGEGCDNQWVCDEGEVEPLNPSPALDFLSCLGVSHHEVHVRVASALRSDIEDEIQRVPIAGAGGNPALLELLKSAWQFRDVPKLRLILVCMLRRLGERIPVSMLLCLGAKKADRTDLKNAELVGQIGPHLQRLVWAADWDAASSELSSDNAGTAERLTVSGSTILADLLRSSVESYVTDATLVWAADHAFVGTVAEGDTPPNCAGH